MLFKVGENLPQEIADLLRSAGHAADTVPDEGLAGAEDKALMARLRTENRALVTLDMDFSDIRTYPPADYAGIVVIRSHVQDKLTLVVMAQRFIPLLSTERLAGRLWIVESSRVRIR